jgi:hypothetical protein
MRRKLMKPAAEAGIGSLFLRILRFFAAINSG